MHCGDLQYLMRGITKEIGSYLVIKHAPYPNLISMCASQEADKHQHKEYRVGGRNGDGAGQATMCIQGDARIKYRVIHRSDLPRELEE